MATGQQLTELPPRDFARLFQTWIQTVNLTLVTAPPDFHALAHQWDWPNPRGAEPDWRRSWEWQYNKNLVGQDALPFRQQDWPNPIAAQQAAQSWIDQTKIALVPTLPLTTFAQYDWPVPRDYARQVQTWTNTIPLALVAKPFAQTDWPNPTPFSRDPTLASIAASYNRNLIGQDRLPNRQQDWPLSDGHRLAQIPLQIMVAGKPFFLVPPVAGPLGIVFNNYDWPLPRDYPPIFQSITNRDYFLQPPPVSPLPPLRTLMGTGV
jgi:hypothetical protein